MIRPLVATAFTTVTVPAFVILSVRAFVILSVPVAVNVSVNVSVPVAVPVIVPVTVSAIDVKTAADAAAGGLAEMEKIGRGGPRWGYRAEE
jgi:hypothetical protein